MFIPWTILSFISGALPFSVWIGRYALKVDIRDYGDKNPGATNVLRAAGYGWFIVALMLDISKAAAPVGLAYYIFGWQGWEILPIALAPPLGHTFSPFLNWRGGKAIAAAFGVWIGLTIWTIPLVGVTSAILFTLLLTPSGWAVLIALLAILITLLAWISNPIFLVVWVSQTALLIYNHRADLVKRPRLRRRRPDRF
jgi:acyl phosphate:glycerol-3-phosphate acyltransferase